MSFAGPSGEGGVVPASGGGVASWTEILDLDISGLSDHDFNGGVTTLAVVPDVGGNLTLESINQGQASLFKVESGEFIMNCNSTTVDFWNNKVTAPRLEFDLADLDSPPDAGDLVQVAFYGTHPQLSSHSSNPSVGVYRRFASSKFINHRAAHKTSGWSREAYEMPGTTGMASGLTTIPDWSSGLSYFFDGRRGGLGLGAPGINATTENTLTDVDWIMGLAIRRGTLTDVTETQATITRIRAWKLSR